MIIDDNLDKGIFLKISAYFKNCTLVNDVRPKSQK